MRNPLIADILQYLQEQATPITEYDLMQGLEDHAAFKALASENQLALFQKHFMIMNALYELQDQLWQDDMLYLHISPLSIEIKAVKECVSEECAVIFSESEALSRYYRDWNNIESTEEADVIALINDFWKRFVSTDKREEALRELALMPDATPEEINKSYRRLAAIHHPDKGGEKEKFIQIRRAYEILKI